MVFVGCKMSSRKLLKAVWPCNGHAASLGVKFPKNSPYYQKFLMKFITVIKFKIKSPNILLKESYKPMWKTNYSKSTLWYRKLPVFTVVWRIETHPNRWFFMFLIEFLNIYKGAFLSPANAQSNTRSTLDTSKIEWV